MPAESFPWRKARTTPRSTGSSPKCAGSFRSTGSTFRRGWRAPCVPTGSSCVANHDFDAVLDGCAQTAPGRTNTWINARIRKLYRGLYAIGHCHTVEVYDNDALVGGLYGVSLGSTFFGESMFHRVRDASKVALVHLVARLKAGRFLLLDTQFVTDHLRTFGAIEVPRRLYQKMLADALQGEADFTALPPDRPLSGHDALQQAIGS